MWGIKKIQLTNSTYHTKRNTIPFCLLKYLKYFKKCLVEASHNVKHGGNIARKIVKQPPSMRDGFT